MSGLHFIFGNSLSPKRRPPQTLYFQGFARVAAYIWLLLGLHCQVEWGRKDSLPSTHLPLPYPIVILLYTFFTLLLTQKTVKSLPFPKTSRGASPRDAQSRVGVSHPLPQFSKVPYSPLSGVCFTPFLHFFSLQNL